MNDTTTTAGHIDVIKRARKDLAYALRTLEPLEGRYLRRLSDSDRVLLQDTAKSHLRLEDSDRDSIYWTPANRLIQSSSSGKAPTVCLKDLREDLLAATNIINVCDWLESFDELGAYLDARRVMLEAEGRITQAARVLCTDPSITPTERGFYLNWQRYA